MKNTWKCSGNKSKMPTNVIIITPSRPNHCESVRLRPSDEINVPSASRAKLGNFSLEYQQFEKSKFIYDVVDIEGLIKSISSVAVCKEGGK